MKRRRFLFWVGFGLFTLAEKLRADVLDGLAAAAMDAGSAGAEAATVAPPIHWHAAENRTWRWFERQTLIKGKWQVTGITTPIHKQTGEAFVGPDGYLDVKQVPLDVRGEDEADETPETIADHDFKHHHQSLTRKARHGRPPSKWLRSLQSDELRIWLKTINPQEAGVEGMSYWEHLTRDHYFDASKIAGLTIDEQAKLHAAAHAGY